ncbi:MAG: hypothetical protein WCK51_05895 [Armatimonadota bacterium]
MSHDPAVELAKELHLLGISHVGIVEVMSQYSHERIRQQLAYLPYRRAKRPEAFLIEAVRNNYSPPKEYFHAQAEIRRSASEQLVDQGSEHRARQTDANSERYGAEGAPGPDPLDGGLEPDWESRDLAIPSANEENRSGV